jgi:hypothetical protein
MKKNKSPKLVLNKQTLRSLEERRMAAVDGGAPPTARPECNNSKVFSNCDTCGFACTFGCPVDPA